MFGGVELRSRVDQVIAQIASTTVFKNKALFAYLQVACEECDGNLNGTV
jgi:hypothetical protein